MAVLAFAGRDSIMAREAGRRVSFARTIFLVAARRMSDFSTNVSEVTDHFLPRE